MGRTILSEITQTLNSIWNGEEKPEDWKESIIVLISKKGDKTDCNSYRAIAHLSITYTFFHNPAVKINSLCRGIYRETLVCILKQ